MAENTRYFLLLCFLCFTLCSASTPTDFIKNSCMETRFPSLCINSLSAYAAAIRRNDHSLAQAALTVSVARAQSAASFVSKLSKTRAGLKPREYGAVKDCVETMGDSIDRLRQSVKEFGHMGGGGGAGSEFDWHMSNVQTWTSAALTDENTCLDGFGGKQLEGNAKREIRRRVVDVARVTSNALALVSRFAARHKAGEKQG